MCQFGNRTDAFIDSTSKGHLEFFFQSEKFGRGFGLANCCKAMEMGFFRFDASLAGMGGCPVIPDAKGNIPTEDFVNLLKKMDIDCDINLDRCVDASLQMSEELGLNPISSIGEKKFLERRNK